MLLDTKRAARLVEAKIVCRKAGGGQLGVASGLVEPPLKFDIFGARACELQHPGGD